MVEAPSVRDAADAAEPYHPVLDSAMEIATDRGRRTALEMIHTVLTLERTNRTESGDRKKA